MDCTWRHHFKSEESHQNLNYLLASSMDVNHFFLKIVKNTAYVGGSVSFLSSTFGLAGGVAEGEDDGPLIVGSQQLQDFLRE